eukprot:111202_1
MSSETKKRKLYESELPPTKKPQLCSELTDAPHNIDFKIFQHKVADKCLNVDECIQIRRLVHSLQYYQSLHLIHDTKQLQASLNKFCTEKYKYLIDDYNHVILCHDDIGPIHSFIQKNYTELSLCDFCTCSLFKRTNRNSAREKEEKNESESNDVEFVFWRDLLDRMHCYMVHLFDSGLRIHRNKNAYRTNNDEDIKYNSCFDSAFEEISTGVSIRRTKMQTTGLRFTRYKNKKFNINMNIIDNRQDTDNKEISDDTKIQEETKTEIEDTNNSSFSIGYIFYYWDYYKHKKDFVQWDWTNQNDHSGCSFAQLFVEEKYPTLKHELLNNNILQISISKYQKTLTKSQKYINCEASKTIKAALVDVALHYGIAYNEHFSQNHLLSILFYTDFNQLSTVFSSTFRAIYKRETIESIKTRNREYCNWSKLLREGVQYFGTGMGPFKDRAFYCGISYLLFPSFVIRLCAPTSTTKQLEVAYNFADQDGIIMQ